MAIKVCLFANTLGYPDGGGHRWVYLNWALGLRSLGCEVIWLEGINPKWTQQRVERSVTALTTQLRHYRLADGIAFLTKPGTVVPPHPTYNYLDLDAATEADLLLSFQYGTRSEVVERFRRSALIDIDPGLLQFWMSEGLISVATYNTYFTIGETVGTPRAQFPDVDIDWQYTPPCVALNWWPPRLAAKDAAFTTVAHWYGEPMEFRGQTFDNSKRIAYLDFLDLPERTGQQFELALDMTPEDEDQVTLWEHGWRVQSSSTVASSPWDYQQYIQDSCAEFSCAKPSCMRLENAWISDRTLCYLASGKPAVIQHTGESRFLPDRDGIFRFRDPEEAAACVNEVAANYKEQCKQARALAVEFFDAKKVVAKVLERALN